MGSKYLRASSNLWISIKILLTKIGQFEFKAIMEMRPDSKIMKLSRTLKSKFVHRPELKT